MRIKNYCVAFLIAGICQIAYAQAPLQNASTEDLVDKLAPRPMQKTRSLSRNLVPESAAPAEKPSVDLVIQFEFGSAKLKDDSKPLLDNLAKAMQGNTLAKYSFNIEGHTDSIGTQSYNLKLSDQRAQSVIHYLISRGVNKNRLQGVGKGFSEPLQEGKSDAPENRRVRIIVNT